MIEICFYPADLRMTLKGHAGAGVPGQDLICCAVSALTYTLAANVRRMQRRGWLKKAGIRLRSGDAEITCTPFPEAGEWVRGRFETISLGYRMLWREYPDFIRYQEMEKEEGNER